MIQRGGELLHQGDVSAARLLFERAAAAGSGKAALAMGMTFEPAVLKGIGALGLRPDPAQAAQWFRRAAELGDKNALALLKTLSPPDNPSSDAQRAVR